MPAQFISTRAAPCAASALASAALTCSSSVTSACSANTLHFGRDFFGIFLALVEHADLGAFGGHGARGGGAETGTSAGDDNGNIF